MPEDRKAFRGLESQFYPVRERAGSRRRCILSHELSGTAPNHEV